LPNEYLVYSLAMGLGTAGQLTYSLYYSTTATPGTTSCISNSPITSATAFDTLSTGCSRFGTAGYFATYATLAYSPTAPSFSSSNIAQA
jgi:hypothetical protein